MFGTLIIFNAYLCCCCAKTYSYILLLPGPSKVPKKLSCWNFERKSAQTVRKSCKHARLAHLDQTFRNQVAQELLVVI